MSKGNDRQHFEEYRFQTRVKHDILAAYLPSYYHILKGRERNLVLIDGFAGRSTYSDENGELVAGSPLRVLRLIANHSDLAEKVSTFFIEHDKTTFAELEKRTQAFYAKEKKIRRPQCVHGKFADVVGEILKSVDGNLAPTFLFVDPCGIDGANFNTISSVMACDKCEAFIFFNIEGIRRTAGLDKLSDTLIELMGSKQKAMSLCADLKASGDPAERETIILNHYRAALRQIGVNYIIPFRVEHEEGEEDQPLLDPCLKTSPGFSDYEERNVAARPNF